MSTKAVLSDADVDWSEMTPERKLALQYRKEYVERELERLGKERIILIDLLRTGKRLSLYDIKEITVVDRASDGTYDIQLRIEDGTKRYGEIYDYISYNPETRFIDEDISLETRLSDESVEQLKNKLDELITKGGI